MRITKEPEERKQEILNTALRLFQEKGYEKTSISDIAKDIGVAQGLCYRYFPSKESLFDSVVDQYAEMLTSAHLRPFQIPADVENDDDHYYPMFHGIENKKFHDQLALKVCEKLIAPTTKILQSAQEHGEIHVDDIDTAASFCVYGQLGILLNENMSPDERKKRIQDFLLYALRL